MEKQFKKGDIVCVYYFHGNRKEINETEVISSGKKYITTKYDQRNKFDAERFHSEYGGYDLFKGTKEECEKYLSKLEDAKIKSREISNYFDSVIDDFDLVNKVYDLVFNKN
jgi:hypothetical protein